MWRVRVGLPALRLAAIFSPGGLNSKESASNAGDLGLIPELGRSPGEGNGYPLQYSGLENSMDYFRGSLRVGHSSVTTHSSTLTLKIPWTEELGAGYYPWGHKESSMIEDFTFTFSLSFTVQKLNTFD